MRPFSLSKLKVIYPCWVALHISGAQHRSLASLFRPTYYIILPAYSGPSWGLRVFIRALTPFDTAGARRLEREGRIEL